MSNQKFIFRRIIAGFIDYAIILSITYLYILKFGEINSEGEFSVNGIKTLPIFIFWFLYICVIETIFNSTLGNYIVKLKPVNLKNNEKINFKQSFLRHIIDPIDMFSLE